MQISFLVSRWLVCLLLETAIVSKPTTSIVYATEAQKPLRAGDPTAGGMRMMTRTLFGSFSGWNRSGVVEFVSVDDRVRGGASISHFDSLRSSSQEETAREACPEPNSEAADARFWGVLNTTALRGAGFASVTTEWADKDTSLDLADFDGILIEVLRADDKRYTFIAKDEIPHRRDDGRLESVVSYEYSFRVPRASSEPMAELINFGDMAVGHADLEHCHRVFIAWSDMTATYRGRKVKNPRPLRTEKIRKLSIMARR